MNDHHREADKCWCYFHPKEVLIGVCPLCLKEKLLVLAAKQSSAHRNIFAFPFFLKSHIPHSHPSTSDQEDSFISIKFEDNGVASWEKATAPKVGVEDCRAKSWNHQDSGKRGSSRQGNCKSVIEHAKPRASLRWRKPVGHLFQLIRWKSRSSKGNVCHAEGAKVMRKGWIRTLTRRRAKE